MVVAARVGAKICPDMATLTNVPRPAIVSTERKVSAMLKNPQNKEYSPAVDPRLFQLAVLQ